MYQEFLVLICSVMLLLHLYFRKKWKVLAERNIPHEPPTYKNFGHAKLMFGRNAVGYELECKKKFGNIWGYYVMAEPRIVIHDVEMIKQIMIKHFSSFPDRFSHSTGMGSADLQNGLLAVTQEHWKRMRSTLAPSFSSAKLKDMSEVLTWSINNMMQMFEGRIHSGNKTFNPKEIFHRLSLDVICSTVFSVDVNSQDDTKPQPEISKRAELFFKNDIFSQIRIFLNISFPFLSRFLVTKSHRQKQVLYFRRLCQKLIAKRRSDESESFGIRQDLMEAMLSSMTSEENIRNGASKGLTENEILGNAISMLLAGYDTTAIAMTYFAYNLAMHSDVQERLVREIDEAFVGKHEVDFDTCSGLRYLDMSIKESLRLYCPVGRTIRTANRTVSIGGVTFPSGCTVGIPIASLCRDPDLWDEPMKFDPERMRDANDIDPIIFQPFGCGPRNCIGMKFAFMEMKLALCTILRRYTFKPTSDTPKPPLELKQFTTTSPVIEINLEIAPR